MTPAAFMQAHFALQGLTHAEVARRLKRSRALVSLVVGGHVALTMIMILRLEEATGLNGEKLAVLEIKHRRNK